MLKKIGLIIIGTTYALAVNSGSININNEDLELGFKIEINDKTSYTTTNRYYMDTGYIHINNDDKSAENTDIINIGAMVENNLKGARSLFLALGIKAVLIDSVNNDFAAPLSLGITYFLPLQREVPIKLNIYLAYAPGSLSFSDLDRYLEKRIELNVELFDHVFIYGGYKEIDLTYNDQATLNLSNSAYAGIKFDF
jgi:hypothetical protein